MKLRATILTLSALAAGAAAPALAQDSPGGGGTRLSKPVTGEQVYRATCQGCHMADGKGGTGAGTIPALAGNPRLGVAAYPITLVLKGKGAMPWFDPALSATESLSPAQIAAVIGYVRTHFGNSYPAPVTEADVAKLAGAMAKP
jgi:mono/diheme cytochrome c family protein